MASPAIADFVRAAKAGGASDEALVALLKQRGWSEAAVYEALGKYYENVTGMEIPPQQRVPPGESAREAFLYLVVFAMLGTWTIALGSLFFALIEIAFPDVVQPRGGIDPRYGIAGTLAAMIVAFPVFLLASATPKKADSQVGKWLTYMAMFLAAGIVVADLITFLAYFLRGELTAQFVLKVLTVLVIGGAVFWYYLVAPRAKMVVGAAAALVVVAAAAGGITQLGSHETQRGIEADARRVEDLRAIAAEMKQYRESHPGLPGSLADLQKTAPHVHTSDPVTGAMYGYRQTSETAYELCATFRAADDKVRSGRFWAHPSGRYCYQMDTRVSR